MRLPKNESSDFEPAPEGNHAAVCIRFLDLGTQEVTYQGETKHQHKVLISWELADEQRDDGEPFMVSKRYTWSMHEKSNLRKDLEAWRGQRFTDADFGDDGFDIRNIVGVPCMVNVTHDTHDGKTYANVTAVAAVPKGLQVGQAKTPPQFFALDELPDMATFEALSERLQATIAASPEWQKWQGKDEARPEEIAADGIRKDAGYTETIPF